MSSGGSRGWWGEHEAWIQETWSKSWELAGSRILSLAGDNADSESQRVSVFTAVKLGEMVPPSRWAVRTQRNCGDKLFNPTNSAKSALSFPSQAHILAVPP